MNSTRKRICWFSRHAPLPSQIAELQRLFGPVDVRQNIDPFGDASELVRRYHASGAEEMVVVVPLSVLQRLCELGVRPLWAEMERVPCSDDRAEVRPTGAKYRYTGDERCFRFLRFRRVVGVEVLFEELEEPAPAATNPVQ